MVKKLDTINYKDVIGNPKEEKGEKPFSERLLDRATHYRDFEIKASWERSKYFILFLGALFVAYYTMKQSDPVIYQFIIQPGGYIKQIPIKTTTFPQWMFLLLTGLGTSISFIWYWVNRGSKLIYENWEHHIDFIENAYEIGNISKVHCWKPFDRLKLLDVYPISPSKANTLVSLLISGAFLILFGYELHSYLYFCGCNNLFVFIFMFFFVYVVGYTILVKYIKSSSYPESNSAQTDIHVRNRLLEEKHYASYKDKVRWTKEK